MHCLPMNSIKIFCVFLVLTSQSMWAGEVSPASLQVVSYDRIHAAAKKFEDKRADHKTKQRVIQAVVIGGMCASFVWGVGGFGASQQVPQYAPHTPHSGSAVPKGLLYSIGRWTLAGIGGLVSWYVREGLLRTLSAFMLNIIMPPFQHLLQTDCALRAADFWLLGEQVKGSSAHYVVVSSELAQFAGILQAWDLLASQVVHDAAVSTVMADRLRMLTEDVLGFVCMQALVDEDSAMHWYFSAMVVQVDQALAQWHATSCQNCTVGQQELEQATKVLQEQFHSITRVLISFPFYRIRSYPLSVLSIAEESLRSFAFRQATQRYTPGA
jgi:hypothetical protein